VGLLGLLLDSEDGGDIILRNVDQLSMANTAVYPRSLFLLSRVSKLPYIYIYMCVCVSKYYYIIIIIIIISGVGLSP
jgi:hypothetical protein